MAPSSLIFYLGCNQKYDKFEHHNLFFDTDFGKHAAEIYDHPQWPTQPLFYVCAPSTTDDSIAPSGCENLFILIPLAAGLEDDMFKREELFELVCNRIKARLNIDLTNDIIYKRSFCLDDFKSEYNSFKGNAYGLSNTLLQTAFLKPKMKSKKINNLYYAGQLTTPGPGVPPSLISGEVVANYINNRHK
jgi:phytoene desaturase